MLRNVAIISPLTDLISLVPEGAAVTNEAVNVREGELHSDEGRAADPLCIGGTGSVELGQKRGL